MKKKLFCLLLILVLPICILFSGCTKKSEVKDISNDESMFVVVNSFYLDDNAGCYVLVNKKTRVMYLCNYKTGTIVMVNEDGTPMIWEGEL